MGLKFEIIKYFDSDDTHALVKEVTEGNIALHISSVKVERCNWNNYTPVIPSCQAELATYIQLIGCLNEQVEVTQLQELLEDYFYIKGIGEKLKVIISAAPALDVIFRDVLYRTSFGFCCESPEGLYIVTNDLKMYSFSYQNLIPKEKLWNFLSLNALTYIASDGRVNLCYNIEAEIIRSYTLAANMHCGSALLMHMDFYKDAFGDKQYTIL